MLDYSSTAQCEARRLHRTRFAIYSDGASIHIGTTLRRNRNIRDRLRAADPPWTAGKLRAGDLGQGAPWWHRCRAGEPIGTTQGQIYANIS